MLECCLQSLSDTEQLETVTLESIFTAHALGLFLTTLKSLYILGSRDNNKLLTIALLHIVLGLTIH